MRSKLPGGCDNYPKLPKASAHSLASAELLSEGALGNRYAVRFDADPLVYPHIYSPVPTDAVTEVRDAHRSDDGTFTGFGPPRSAA